MPERLIFKGQRAGPEMALFFCSSTGKRFREAAPEMRADLSPERYSTFMPLLSSHFLTLQTPLSAFPLPAGISGTRRRQADFFAGMDFSENSE
jgi:hypothetical protein